MGLWCFGEACGDGVSVNVILASGEVLVSADLVVSKTSLPDGKFRGEAVGEASLDKVHDLRDCFVAWSEDEMDVVGHQDERVEQVVRAVVFEGFEEEFRVAVDLEDAATVVADGGEEEGACGGGSLRDCHSDSLWVVQAVVKDF
jgi:hypothetical protein